MSQTTQVRAVLVTASFADQAGTCGALLPLAGKCALDYWLDTLKSCSRLQPIREKVVVVGESAHQQQLQDWATSAGLPSTSIATSSCTGFLQGLVAAAAAWPELARCHVLVADASFVLEPGSSVSRLVEAAVVRGKDTLTCTVPFEGADLSNLVQVHKADAVTANSRVSIQTASTGAADGCIDTIMGPVAVLAPSSMALLHELAGQISSRADAEHAATSGVLKEFGWCMQHLQEQHGAAVYAVDLPFYFIVKGEDFALTDAFIKHYRELQRVGTREVQQLAVVSEGAGAAYITGTLHALVSRLESLGSQQPPSPVRQQLKETVSPARSPGASVSGSGVRSAGTTVSLAGPLSGNSTSSGNSGTGNGSSSLKHMFEAFCVKYQQQLAKQSKEPKNHDYNTLPSRFQHPESWQLRTKQQHPCYLTTNNDYGAKQPTEFIMPLVWAGIHGKFTNTFHGGCYHSMGLKTSMERSRVHRELDYL